MISRGARLLRDASAIYWLGIAVNCVWNFAELWVFVSDYTVVIIGCLWLDVRLALIITWYDTTLVSWFSWLASTPSYCLAVGLVGLLRFQTNT